MSFSKLSDVAIEAILKSRAVGRPELCVEHLDAWLKSFVTQFTPDRALREDLVQECLVYFLETVYRWIEPRDPKSVRESLRLLMKQRILYILRGHRVRSRVDRERLNVSTESHSDFTGVYARETILRNSTPRQQQILNLVMDGYSFTEISKILRTSRKTIQNIRATMVT